MEEWIWWLMIIIGLIVLTIFFIIMIVYLSKMIKESKTEKQNLILKNSMY